MIGPEGVYLSASSLWYPDKPDGWSEFEVEATIPAPFRIVTQGELLSEELVAGSWKSRWRYDLPTESLTLVAGNYSVKTRTVDGVKLSTYFFKDDDRFSEDFLEATAEYLNIYTRLLGPFPYKKFDIVQNFFSSGYGIPTFTLLSPDTIRQGKEFLRPGALDHEIVHSWWGHYVSMKPEGGNWVEALTTYCTNYYYKELKLGEEAARKHRQDVMQKYAIQVPAKEDYPLRRFEGKAGELDGQIGYGKGSMVFHMLRRGVGEERFFGILRDFSRRYGGRQASWDDIRTTFEGASGKNLEKFFAQWLDRPGGPRLRLENVAYEVTPGGYRISGNILQQGEVYELSLPVEVDLGAEKKRYMMEISDEKNSFSVEVPGFPLTLSVDPDHHVFRKIGADEITPCLNVLLEDPGKIFVLPDAGPEGEESRKIYANLAEMAKERKGGKILSPKEFAGGDLPDASLILLGDTWKLPVFSKLLSGLSGALRFKDVSFFLDGKRVGEDDDSLLLTLPHPSRPGRWVSLYFGASGAALSRARYIFFYGWDSYILFKKGRPQVRGNFLPVRSPLVHDFLLGSDSRNPEIKRLRDHISFLSSPGLGGRLPGTPGYERIQPYLLRHLVRAEIQPLLQPFSIAVKDVNADESRLILLSSPKEVHFRTIPFLYSKEGEWVGPCLFESEEGMGLLDDLHGKAVVFSYCPQCHEENAREFLFSRIMDLELRGASAVLVLIQEEELELLAPYVTYPSYFPPKIEEKLRAKEKAGYSINRAIEASKIATRAKAPDFPVHVPVLFVPHSEAEEEKIRRLFGQKDVSVAIHIHFKETMISDSNIGGILEGRDPELKKEFIVLGAHYDHLGRDEKSGDYYSGADDNASGVAAVLEAGRLLAGRKDDLKRSLLILFFGGEEWGLLGSSHFVENPLVPLSRIKSMFSLDSIGGKMEEREVFFVGRSKYPPLAEKARKYLKQSDLREGKDIDPYAFEHGSDHYPFHLQGIPSIDLFASDYRKLHSLRDKPELIDFDKLADVTKLVYWTIYEMLTEP
jgi:hypothetical protein